MRAGADTASRARALTSRGPLPKLSAAGKWRIAIRL